MNDIIVVCGPTASGKSAFALKMAQSLGGVIINADAMQVYKQIPIITASPSKHDLQKAQHYLYNHVDVAEEYSAAKYIKEATDVIKGLPEGKPAIVVGGTGLYVNSLIYGIHKIPDISDEIRQDIRRQANDQGAEYVYEKLKKVDALSGSKLNSADLKRVCRAYEVFMQTGKTIDSFYSPENFYKPLDGYSIKTFFLNPERKFLYKICDTRFDGLLSGGAIHEAAHLLESWDTFNTSAKKALGLAQIISYLKGEIPLTEAKDIGKMLTRNFAKRQITWFKNQLQQHEVVVFNDEEEFTALLAAK
jgi:tRNA dimethylallyltransferase